MGQLATTIRIVVWSCLVLWTLGRAVPSVDSSPKQHVILTSQEPTLEPSSSSSTTTMTTDEEILDSNVTMISSTTAPTTETTFIKSTTMSEVSEETKGLNGNIITVESSEVKMCAPHLCDAQSTLVVTVDPVGNKTGYVSRASGLPVLLHCALLTQGRHVSLPTIWRLPNATEISSDKVYIYSVDLKDSGEYTCRLAPHECCAHVRPDRVHLSVYELSAAAGIVLMISVLTSIVILVIVFIYSQKKKKYHSWLKHEILAASSSSGDSTPRSTLNRDMQANSKKYLLNT